MTLDPATLAWPEGANPLLPATVQHAHSGQVLMQAWMSPAALERTLASGRVTFWSRSREALWTKGETSGHWLALVALHTDCDADSLLVQALPDGPTCHLGTTSCFDSAPSPPAGFLAELDALVAERARSRPAGAYTTRLLDEGVTRVAQKVGEEGVEVALAAATGSDEALLGEAADLGYHLLVLLRARGLALADVVEVLRKRHALAQGPAAPASPE